MLRKLRKFLQRRLEGDFSRDLLHHRGSLLLEIAVGLSVIGLISGFFITKSITMGRIARERKTRDNIEVVTAALASYLATHRRLPCPAVLDAPVGSDTVGIRGYEKQGCVIGAVPYNTLGISEKSALDGKGRPLIYIVNSELTDHFESIYFDENKMSDPLSIPRFFCDSTILPNIRISSSAENSDIVAFVIDTIENSSKILRENDNVVIVRPGPYTFWIRRNFLLIHYLKGCPCNREIPNDE